MLNDQSTDFQERVLALLMESHTNSTDPHKENKQLRDWFAGQALAGWLASYGFGEQYPVESADVLARCFYVTADAMMKARAA